MTKTKTITERLHEVLPEIQEQKRVSEQLRRYRNQGITASTQEADKAFQQVKDHVLELIIAGHDVPADVARPILEARERDELATLRSTALNRVARDAESSGARALATNAEDTTTFLRTELARVVAEVRDLTPDLAGISSAEEAIATGSDAITAWQRATRCVEDYDEIRQLQFQLAKNLTDDLTSERFLRSGILADAIDVQGYWIDRRRHSANLPERGGISTGSNRGNDYRKWLLAALPNRPFDYTSSWWQDGESKVEHLMRLVRDATPWLPSPDEMMDAGKHAASATAQVTVDQPSQMETTRRAYYNLTGARPKVKLPDPPEFVRGTSHHRPSAKFDEKLRNAKDRAQAQRERTEHINNWEADHS